MGEVEDASPIRQLLERESLAAIAEPSRVRLRACAATAGQVVVADQHHVARFGGALCDERHTGQYEAHDQERNVKGCAHGGVFYAVGGASRGASVTTVSMCGVWGNMSTGCIDSIAYSWRTISCKSRASVSGLQET